ncbi:glycosyltransferase [Arenibacter sp. ARW7G5Y1]|uniref:glycosyltransferase n=1 Tax=Arenibacter sp. ARW7G5Y1 TaxID=2135619 RepID=UPI000D75D9D4|nr:glycosyltransferase [Arenibacter sp. ARW7G5Y1]PXX25037.1 glycosyltransferase involved in cell wall biosynthesis [Arenibacter sp. ARW7G5Y1]
MRILFLIEELGGGGKERRLVELLKKLSNYKEDFEIYLTLAKTAIDYEDVKKLPINLCFLPQCSNISLIKIYKNHFKEIRPDIVHTWSFKSTLYASLLKPLFKYNIVAGFIGDTYGQSLTFRYLSEKFIYKRVDAIISNSEAGLKAYKVPLLKGKVVPNGFDPGRLVSFDSSKPILHSLGICTQYTVIMVANVTKNKDYKSFIKVAEELTKIRKDVTFVSVGKINPEFKEMVSPYINNRHDKIKFIGFNSTPELLISESDIGLLCSDCEGISNSIMEYMAAGLPVITTDLKGASRELVLDEETGFICSKEKLTKKLTLLLDSETLRKEMGSKSSHRISSKYSLNKMIKEYIELYTKIKLTTNKTN